MPIFDIGCAECEYLEKDRFFHKRLDDYGLCPKCGSSLGIRITSMGVPLTKTFAEDREVIDLHIRPDGKPQRITSWGQRQRLMKEFNLEEAGAKRGTPGCWS